MKLSFFLICILCFPCLLSAQDLTDLFEEEKSGSETVASTFKTTRIVSGQSIENPPAGNLNFLVSHHFGMVNQGIYELFGLDQSSARIGFEYGVNSRLALGVGRSTYQKTFDGFTKIKLLRQATGDRAIPVSVSWFSSVDINSLKWQDTSRDNLFSSRIAYTHQMLIARKFNNKFSLQIMPVLVHKNLVERQSDPNDIFAIGTGGRYKITNRVSVNTEYYYVPQGQLHDGFFNSFSVGFDIETGGHVFQLHLTNSTAMFERGFITETIGKWDDGGIHFGFNINRYFTLRKPKF